MTKSFEETFPGVCAGDEELSELYPHLTVTRVTVNAQHTTLKVYVEADRLIDKKDIRRIEKRIDEEVCSDSGMETKIIEKFRLSQQYNARNLMKAYRASILYELDQYDKCLGNLFRHADVTFGEDGMCHLVLEDTIVARRYEEQLCSILEKIFTDRCGVDFRMTVGYKEASTAQKTRQFRAIQTMQKAEETLREAGLLQKMQDAEPAAALENGDHTAAGNSESVPAGDSGAAGGRTAGMAPGSRTGGFTGKTGKGSQGVRGRRGRGNSGLRGDSERSESLVRSSNPDVLYGRDFEDLPIEMKSILGEMGDVTIRGQVSEIETRDIHTKRGSDLTILIITLTDFTDTMRIKMFLDTQRAPQLTDQLKTGMFIKVRGVTTIDKFDSDLTIGNIYGIMKIADFRQKRSDTWPRKRVELHCHTKMSAMDAVSEPGDLVKAAASWGHKAIAITDHGVVQGLPDAYKAIPEDSDFKVIYGCEGYLVNDLVETAVNSRGQALEGDFVVFDLETTGFSPVENQIIEIGAVKVSGGKIVDRFSEFVNPLVPIPLRIENLTSINDAMVADAPTIEEILPRFLAFSKNCVLVAHNSAFDVSFIEENCRRLGYDHDFTSVDTVALARVLLPNLGKYKLDTVAKALNIDLGHHHRAVDDAECTAHIFVKFVSMLEDLDLHNLDEVNEHCRADEHKIRKMPTYHVILLAKNETGRVNLYRCVSESHLKYVSNGKPHLPKSFLKAHRDGLIIGSACEAGELFQAIERGASEEELKRIVDFYDYLEIQPIGNNMFLTVPKYDKNGNLRNEPKTVEDLKNYNRRIVALGEQYGKPVCATCDVHFLNPEDEIYRRILQYVNFQDPEADNQPPLYLRTTEEMLKEFEYLGEEKANEVVITNTNRIADMVEKFSPVRPDKCPPVIPHSDEMLTKICYDRAHEIYGDDLPQVVEDRLKKELHSIISNGFAVMYIIAQKLVWKSVADGYLVGSRGSVGSSFVANMAGITEVNSLHPHYLCPNCHYVDFDSPEVRKYDGMAGCDMPDKNCPKCGTKLQKLGFDIPFETFLGFKGNKEPDIDLNFSGEYQSKAHHYTEVIFGAGQTFRAGTVTGVADKNAYGYVLRYFEDHGEKKRPAEIKRLADGCVGVRKSTGQHPGGIIVLPYGEEINTFTPVQHPPKDENTITTHFDYHKIDHNLLKLDILGHDDPTMIRMLEDLTGLHATDVPLDDKKVMSLFQNTSALGITPDDIGGCPLGSLGIPEFGTDFAIQMLVDTKPKYFSDLVRIAGLAHGTDVWLGNAQDLIMNGTCTISTAICCRDDIMIYLISKGLDPELSFTIMEKVRKGKGLRPEWEEEMKKHGVPDWYIGSCKKIKYMFPKAHAAAYVMMAWRIAWFKIYQPLAYYAAFFSIRSPGFDYELMCEGPEVLARHMKEIEAKDKNEQQQKEQEQYKAMKVVREMYARGYEFAKIDVFKCRATKFCIVDGKLMPSLNKIDGLGDNVAAQIVDACKDGPFLSLDNFRERTKCPKGIADKLVQLGILAGLPESNQLSIFDMLPTGTEG